LAERLAAGTPRNLRRAAVRWIKNSAKTALFENATSED